MGPNKRISAKMYECPSCQHRTNRRFGKCFKCGGRIFKTPPETSKEDRKFVRLLLSGIARTKAYEAAFPGHTPSSVRQLSYLKYHEPPVQKLLEELREEMKEDLAVDLEKIQHRLASIAFAKRIRYEDVRKTGTVEGLTEEEAAAISEIVPNEHGGYRVKFYSPIEAMDMLNKIHGHYEKDNKQKGLDAFFEYLGKRTDATNRTNVLRDSKS